MGYKKIFLVILFVNLSLAEKSRTSRLGGYSYGEDPSRKYPINNTPKQCLQIVYEWKDLEYDFPNKRERDNAIRDGNYVAGNGVPIDVAPYFPKHGSPKVFTTIPRFTTGIPFSLAVVSSQRRGPNGPILKPYPNYDWHSSHGQNCDGITSVFRVAIDECKRLWVLDTGKIGDTQYCQPQLLVFDLRSDELIHRYRFPETQYNTNSLFITPIVDIRDSHPRGSCNDAKVYIADVTSPGLLVYDSMLNSSWRIENDLFGPLEEFSTITVAGESFTLRDGVFGLSVTPKSLCKHRHDCNRMLYFHALASNTENAVPLSVLDNQSLWADSATGNVEQFQTVGTRDVQNAAMAIDKKGNLFSSPMQPIGITSWNIEKPYTTNTLKVENAETLQFISGMKIVKSKNDKEELWALSCRFQKIMAGTKNPNEINFRIQVGSVHDILSGPC